MDLSGPAFSLSVAIITGGGMASTSASNAEETMRARTRPVREVWWYYMDEVSYGDC